MTRSILMLVLVMGCRGLAQIEDECGEVDLEGVFIVPECLPCMSDSDCVIKGNACLETAYCAHIDDDVPVPSTVCDREYRWPPDEDCLCLHAECRYLP